MIRTLSIVFLLAFASPAFAAPPAWTVDSANSAIAFSGTHAGKAFNGAFKTWRADIRFDPADLAHSKAVVVIETATARTGDKLQETTLAQDEWFDVKDFPTATFAAADMRALGGNKYEADGTLTIKGKAVPVKLPFTLTIAAGVAHMTGAVTLDRAAFNLGLKSDPNAEWVSKTIAVSLDVRATKAP